MKRILTFSFLLLSLTALISGCSSTSGTKEGSGLDGSATGGVNEADLNSTRNSRFGDGAIPGGEEDGPFRNVYFDYDSSNLSDTARQDIEYNVQVIEQYPEVKVQLEGHCDERGTAEYNLALGQRRAQAVHDVLVSFGVNPSRLSTISYGEEVPLQDGASESAFAKNRRVHFSGYTDKK